jgi:transcriptional regulator with XRE-family HTH domain
MKKTGEIDIKLGQAIVNQRMVSGISRKELAEAIGITHQQMQKYEKGINRISVSRLHDIAAALKIQIVKFLEPESETSTNCDMNNGSKALTDIMKYINKITDETKLLAIKNLIKSISVN